MNGKNKEYKRKTHTHLFSLSGMPCILDLPNVVDKGEKKSS